MRSSAVGRAVSLVGLGAAGLVGGHAIAYALAVPDVHHRSALVAQTGHGYLPSLSWVAAALGLGAVVAAVGAGYLQRGRGAAGRLRRTVLRLVPVQVGAFASLEVLERLVAGAPLGTFSPRLAVIGVITQVVVSVVAAILLVGLRRVGEALAREPRLMAPRAISERLAVIADQRGGLSRRWAGRVRAPPAHAA